MTNARSTFLQESFQKFVQGDDKKKRFMKYVYTYMNLRRRDFRAFLCNVFPDDPRAISILSKPKPPRIRKSAVALEDEIDTEDDDDEMTQVSKKNVPINSLYYNSGNKVRYLYLSLNSIILAFILAFILANIRVQKQQKQATKDFGQRM
jgi:CRISPR/Cas system-associated protein Cas7 (RAMP superfamily)